MSSLESKGLYHWPQFSSSLVHFSVFHLSILQRRKSKCYLVDKSFATVLDFRKLSRSSEVILSIFFLSNIHSSCNFPSLQASKGIFNFVVLLFALILFSYDSLSARHIFNAKSYIRVVYSYSLYRDLHFFFLLRKYLYVIHLMWFFFSCDFGNLLHPAPFIS